VPRTQELNRDAGAGLRPLALPDYRKRLDIREFVARRNSAAGTGLTPVGLGTLFCALNKATERIRIATPFLSVSLLWGLRSALYEGIQVRVLTSFWQENEFADEVIRLVEEHSNFELKVHHPGREVGALHAKYFMIDDVLAVYGSANFTVKSWRNNHEQVLASDDPAAIKHLVEAFERKWVDGSALRIQDLADVVQRNPPH
jgi:phosphatidylserine/phosphatidylglycerophosphate/cardiolipin synthase-like enzyme